MSNFVANGSKGYYGMGATKGFVCVRDGVALYQVMLSMFHRPRHVVGECVRGGHTVLEID